MGAATGSAFGGVFAAENLAVKRALHSGGNKSQQDKGAKMASNIAILVFSLVMNVVPVAFIADVNTIGMLLYTLLTGVLTAVPPAVRGVEILIIGLRSNSVVVTRISDASEDLNLDTDTNGRRTLSRWPRRGWRSAVYVARSL